MPPMNLRWTALGRPVKPVAFSLMMTMLILAVVNILNVGILGTHAAGDVLAGLSIAGAALLFTGWFRRSQSVAELGLAAAFFVWSTRFFLGIFISPDPLITEGIYLSLCWAMVAGGSYLLEKMDVATGRGF